jgi:Cu/Ag efflux pump CusA
VSSTASQAGETDQTTRIDSTEHPESCQLASPARNLKQRKTHPYSALKQPMRQLPGEASQKTKPAQNRFPEATTISHIKRHNVTINRNRNAIYHFRSIAIKIQSECPKISTLFQFSGSAIEN